MSYFRAIVAIVSPFFTVWNWNLRYSGFVVASFAWMVIAVPIGTFSGC